MPVLVAVFWLWLICWFVQRMFRRALWEAFPNGVPGPLENPWIIIALPLWFLWMAHAAAVRFTAALCAGVAVLFYWGNKESTLDAQVTPKSMLVVAAIAYVIASWIFTMLFHGADAAAETAGRTLDSAELKFRRRAEQARLRAAAEAERKERARRATLERERREAQEAADRRQREERQAAERASREADARARADERRQADERRKKAQSLKLGLASLTSEVRQAGDDAAVGLLARSEQLRTELVDVDGDDAVLARAEAAYRTLRLDWSVIQQRIRRRDEIARLDPSAASYFATVEQTWARVSDPREVIDGWFGLDLHGYSVKRALEVVRLAAAEAAGHGVATLAILHGSSSHHIRDALRCRIAGGELQPVVRGFDGINDAVTWVRLSVQTARSGVNRPVELPERDRDPNYRRRDQRDLSDLSSPWAA